MLIVRRTLLEKTTPANTDDVLACAWIPTGGRLVKAWLDVSLKSTVHAVTKAVLYGTNAFLLPVDDPDAQVTADVIWDRQVPKDVEETAGAYDLDTVGLVATPEFEIGEVDLAGMFQTGPYEISGGKRRSMVTFANNPVGFDGDNAFIPTSHFKMKLGGTPRVYEPSVVCFGLSSPEMVDSTNTEWTSPTEKEWSQLQYAGMTLEQTLVEQMGLATGSPWADASAFLFDYAEPDAFEENGSYISPCEWLTFCKATFIVDVPGTLGEMTVTTDS